MFRKAGNWIVEMHDPLISSRLAPGIKKTKEISNKTKSKHIEFWYHQKHNLSTKISKLC